MGVFVILKASPVEKQSIGDVYAYRNLPASLTKLSSLSATCPVTVRDLYRKPTTKYC